MRLARKGQPGALEVRFGSGPGEDDLGVARLEPEAVRPQGDAWHLAEIAPRPVEPGMLIHYDIRCAGGEAPEDHYVIYGPRPIGGRELARRFALSYRVLTDRPQDALP